MPVNVIPAGRGGRGGAVSALYITTRHSVHDTREEAQFIHCTHLGRHPEWQGHVTAAAQQHVITGEVPMADLVLVQVLHAPGNV